MSKICCDLQNIDVMFVALQKDIWFLTVPAAWFWKESKVKLLSLWIRLLEQIFACAAKFLGGKYCVKIQSIQRTFKLLAVRQAGSQFPASFLFLQFSFDLKYFACWTVKVNMAAKLIGLHQESSQIIQSVHMPTNIQHVNQWLTYAHQI